MRRFGECPLYWRAHVSRLATETAAIGLPGLKHDPLLARVPVYGTQDAGRGFWKKFRRTLIAGGVRENRVLSAVYCLTDGQLQGIDAFDGPVGQGVITSHSI